MGEKSLDIDVEEPTSVRELIDRMIQSHPELGNKLLDENDQLYANIHVYVNGRDTLYSKQGAGTQIDVHDKVDIFPHGHF
jgi:molybdopterin converting factor small subunit